MEQQEFRLFGQPTVLTVSELVEELRIEVESRFRDLWVAGEISNLSQPSSGHLYFTLKDDKSQLSVVCFRMQSRYLRFAPENGMEVIVRGSAGLYAPRGQLQLIAESMEPRGRGALQVAFEQLKQRLDKEGLFSTERKRPLPLLPRRIGVVTSPSGAAFQDILRVLERRNRGLSVLLYPARVQGDSAPGEVAAGIEALGKIAGLDVIIVTRGGGSLEDLWAFNEEVVARAVFSCPLPVISAVGHEIDFTITDFVADLRAATPSAAAEMVTGKREELQGQVSGLGQRATSAIRLLIQQRRHRLQQLVASRGLVDAGSRVRQLSQRLDELQARLSGKLPGLLARRRQQLAVADLGLSHSTRTLLDCKTARLREIEGRLTSISPLRVLERGYAIVTDPEGAIIRSPDQAQAGASLTVQVEKGRFRVRREEKDGIQGL